VQNTDRHRELFEKNLTEPKEQQPEKILDVKNIEMLSGEIEFAIVCHPDDALKCSSIVDICNFHRLHLCLTELV